MDRLLESYNLDVFGFPIQVNIVDRGSVVTYEIEEPPASAKDLEELEKLKLEILEKMPVNGERIADISGLRQVVIGLVKGEIKSDRVSYYILRDLVYYGPLTPFFWDKRIEDITVTSYHSPVTVYLKEYGYVQTNVTYKSEEEIVNLARRLSQLAGKQLSLANPVVDGNLPDGSRIQISLGGVIATNGTSFTIRRFREKPISFVDLCLLGTLTPDILAFIWTCIEYGANIIVTGGTAAGKTTFLNAILQFVPQSKKIVTIEDTREINIIHDNWIPMVTRSSPVQEGQPGSSIDMFRLLESALRHRPNYIIVGEVRGKEAFTIFQALSAGRYGLATFHADDFEGFLHRMESNPINLPRTLLSTLDIVIVLSTQFGSYGLERRLNDLIEIVGLDADSGDIISNYLYHRERDGYQYAGFSYVLDRIRAREGISAEDISSQVLKREKLIRIMIERGLKDYDKISAAVDIFQHDQDRAVSFVEGQ
ncbi:MAG: type II/IV secretion system ATPase subunit [Thermoplasmataceae archaeon]